MIRTGIDIIEISRVADKIEKNANFKSQILTENEIVYCDKKVGSIKSQSKQFQTIAGMYAAKEAFYKALGTGIGSVSNLKKIEIAHDKCGAPYIEVIDKTILENFNDIKDVSISISHDGNTAIAICIIES